jgi:hypothetical protein
MFSINSVKLKSLDGAKLKKYSILCVDKKLLDDKCF